MAGFVVHQGANVLCSHVGAAQPMTTYPRVTVSGYPIVTTLSTYSISSCTLASVGDPCVTGTWIAAALRLTAGGAPVVLFDSQSVCQPNGAPLLVLQTQTRARGA